MLKLRSAQLLGVKKPNLFNDLKKGVFLPEQSNTLPTSSLVNLCLEMGVTMGGTA